MESNVLLVERLLRMGKGKKITWSIEWVKPYESMWSIIEKIKIANVITGKELLLILDPESYQNNQYLSPRRKLHKLSMTTYNKLKEQTGVDFLSIHKEMLSLSKLERNNPLHYFNTHLCYYELCVQNNYHSYVHQYKLIEVCPFHQSELHSCCPNCDKQIYYYNVAMPVPFTCGCGMQLYEIGSWRKWLDFQPILEVDNVQSISDFEKLKYWLRFSV